MSLITVLRTLFGNRKLLWSVLELLYVFFVILIILICYSKNKLSNHVKNTEFKTWRSSRVLISDNVFWKTFIQNQFLENENKLIDIWRFRHLIKRAPGVHTDFLIFKGILNFDAFLIRPFVTNTRLERSRFNCFHTVLIIKTRTTFNSSHLRRFLIL